MTTTSNPRRLSDPDSLPKLIHQTLQFHQQTQTHNAQLTSQLEGLSTQLTNLADKKPDPTSQEYNDAVNAVENATQILNQGQSQAANAASVIEQVTGVVAALTKLAASAAPIV